MHQDEQLERKLKQLKQSYDEMSTFSNAEQIANKIHQANIKQKRVNKRRWLPLTATIATVALAGLLFVITPGLFSGESLDDSQQSTMELARDNESGQEENSIESGEQDPPKEPDAGTVIPAKERPEEMTDEIEVEGMPQKVTFKLISNDELQFSTYYPEEMLAESSGNRIKMIANFGGVKNEDAYIEFFGKAINGDASVSDAENQLLSDFEYGTLTEKNESDFWVPLSDREFLLLKDEFSGVVSLFERNGMLYRITIHYPMEYGDGFDPRAAKIINEMMWYDETTTP